MVVEVDLIEYSRHVLGLADIWMMMRNKGGI